MASKRDGFLKSGDCTQQVKKKKGRRTSCQKYHAIADDGTESWPSSHLRSMIAAYSPQQQQRPAVEGNIHSDELKTKDIDPKKKLCVLLTTGAMNPVHRGHVAMMTHAKDALELFHGFVVVGGFISPSHDLYVGPKSKWGEEFANAQDRVAMCRLAVEGVDWLEVGTWEAREIGMWPDFPVVLDNLTKHISSVNIELNGTDSQEISVFYVCGTDHARHCDGLAHSNRGLVVISRKGHTRHPTDAQRLVFGAEVPSEDIQGLSSTAVRKACQSGNSVQLYEILHHDVAAYITRCGLYCWQQSCSPMEVSCDSDSCLAHSGYASELVAGKIVTNKTVDACVTKITNVASKSLVPVPGALNDVIHSRRTIFISASALARKWRRAETKSKSDNCGGASANALNILRKQCNNALFFFGSKRSWLFPENEAEKKESNSQGEYEPPSFPPELSALIKEKESRTPSEVYFLKPPSLKYKGFGYGCHPINHLAPAFQGASTWIESHGLEPLILTRDWWLGDGYDLNKSHTGVTGRDVVDNYEIGEHDYNSCIELLSQSNPTLDPVE